ncbi:MAG: hypothetical protein KDD89_12455, partial [Anaerolineales bacterium]|nr:hypothetical protein [Anaerolineales bacterium]
HEAFVAGEVHTGFLAEHFGAWRQPTGAVKLAITAVTLAQYEQQVRSAGRNGYWRNSPNAPLVYRYAEQGEVRLTPKRRPQTGYWLEMWQDVSLEVEGFAWDEARHTAVVITQKRRHTLTLVQNDGVWWVQTSTGIVQLTPEPLLPEPHPPADAGGSLKAPMPGLVLEVLVQVGEQVVEGQALLKLEAMKMEHTIRSGADGVVREIYFTAGEQVTAEAQLLRIESKSHVHDSE